MSIVHWRVCMAMILGLSASTLPAAPPGLVVLKPDLNVTLRARTMPDQHWFEGVDGVVGGVVNPALTVRQGAVVRIVLENGDDQRHQLVIPDLDLATEVQEETGSRTALVFRATRRGRFDYFCSTPGHREAGATGVLTVGEPAAASRGAPGEPFWSQSPR